MKSSSAVEYIIVCVFCKSLCDVVLTYFYSSQSYTYHRDTSRTHSCITKLGKEYLINFQNKKSVFKQRNCKQDFIDLHSKSAYPFLCPFFILGFHDILGASDLRVSDFIFCGKSSDVSGAAC